jgi:CCR4-NOT transcription complex subunit 2
LQEETLFYVFYSMPLDEAQFIAADELYSRGWFWHRRFKLWMITAPGSTPTQKTARGERCGYLVFDPQVWEVVPREVDILYEDLEQHPRLPRPKHMASAAKTAATNNAGQAQAPVAAAGKQLLH